MHGLVENEKKHIESVAAEERIALPLLELALEDSGYYCDSAYRDTYGEVEDEVYLINVKRCAVDNCAKGKNKGGVDDVCADDVTYGERVLLLADSGESGYKLGERGSESYYGEADDGGADVHAESDSGSRSYKELCAKHDSGDTNDEPKRTTGDLLLLNVELFNLAALLLAIEKVDNHECKEDCPEDERRPYGKGAGKGEKGESDDSREEKTATDSDSLSLDSACHSYEGQTHDERGVCGNRADRITDSELRFACHCAS